MGVEKNCNNKVFCQRNIAMNLACTQTWTIQSREPCALLPLEYYKAHKLSGLCTVLHIYNASDLYIEVYIAKVHNYSLETANLTCTSCDFYPKRINQNPNKATSIKLQQSETKVAATDVTHGDAHGITQHLLASSSSPAVSQAYTMYKQI